ncbi:hypothetical protein Ndes2526B_g03280 [Nannochloris sp. 'desiccata']
MKTACALILLLAVSSVQSRTLQQGCPIAANDITSLDLGNVNAACGGLRNPPDAAMCDACGEVVGRSFAPLVPKLGLECGSFSSAYDYVIGIVNYLVQNCPAQALSGLRDAGVSVQPLVNWQYCPQDASNPLLVSEVQKVCPNLS